LVGAALVGCSNNDGSDGAAGSSGVVIAPVQTATALTITITGASVSSPPVVNFRVTNQNGESVTGLADADLRFNIAKLVPGTFGNPYTWQNYINRASGGAVQGSQERFRTQKDYGWGSLVPHGDGTYTYTFCTDITNVTNAGANQNFANCSQSAQPNFCPVPCSDANGNALDVGYQPGLTHRISIQQANTAYPKYNATFDFVPAGGSLFGREIVRTGKCNECHNQLAVHGGTRVETKLCVTCHNPGSWVAGAPNTPVDFKVMIHKIHRGANLPSVLGPDGVAGTADDGKYAIGTSDFSTVAFPQDIRNCTKCHDGTDPATPQGDNWKIQPSREACGSCHDNVNFATGVGHAGGIKDNSTCLACHSSGGEVGPVETSHAIPEKAARGKFAFKILKICGTALASKPVCAPASIPTVTFSVYDPSGATSHAYGNNYAPVGTKKDPEFGTGASMTVDIAWDTRDYNNTGGSAARPARANQINVFGTTGSTSNYGNASIPAYPAAVDNGDGTFTVTAPTPLPDGTAFPNIAASGSGAVALEGRAIIAGTTTRVGIKGEVQYFGITEATPTARRVVVDVVGKCDNCHDQLALHGGSRNDNAQLCVICHNPNNTDAQASARTKFANGLPNSAVIADGKKEEAIDFKRMIHGIHAGAKTSLDSTKTLFGFREKGLWVSGNDYSGVRFPGILNDCTTCHLTGTYELTGIWDPTSSTFGSVLGSTVDSTPGLTSADTSATVNAALQNPVDDLNISPTAAVCSSCHDGSAANTHMQQNGGLFSSTQAAIGANIEQCVICHGPGRVVDVKVVHGVK
jgi:OmcA/MtrC family decaheme c-type cytochrome